MLAARPDGLAEFGAERTARAMEILSRRLERPVRMVKAWIKGDLSTAFADRSFWLLEIEAGQELKKVHVKVAERSSRGRALDERLNGLGLPIPDYLGSFSLGKTQISMWEHHDGFCAQSFATLAPVDIRRIAHAVACISALPLSHLADIELEKGIKWVEPVAGKARKLLKAKGRLAEVREELKLLTRIETDVVDELSSLESATLIHNDVKAPNVIIGSRITIVDWESATVGPHGASLRRFSRHEPHIECLAANTYIDSMAKFGVKIDQAKLLRVMRFQEIFWALSTGVRRGSAGRIISGLRLASELHSRPSHY